MKEILIINLTRMGDILQKTPLILGLKAQYPQARVSILVSSSFSEICRGMPFIDKVYALDKADLLTTLRDERVSLIQKIRRVEEMLKPLREVSYDLIVNLTHSRSSAVLLYLLRAGEIKGLTIDTEGHRCIKHPWMRYFFCAVTNRSYNSFNLVDMYLRAAQVPCQTRRLRLEVSKEDEVFAEEFLNRHGVSSKDVLIGLQPGASDEGRCWPLKSCANLADRLMDDLGAKVILLGGPAEKKMGDGIVGKMQRVPANAVGDTTVLQCAALLKRCRVLVCPDTGPMHIATAVGTKVVALFLNTAYYPETGPYGEGHLVLHSDISCYPCDFGVQCLHRVCREDISVNHVFRAVKMGLGVPAVEAMGAEHQWMGVSLLKSGFDEDGFVEYRPVIRRPLALVDLLRELYREMWKRQLSRQSEDREKQIQRVLYNLSRYYMFDVSDNFYRQATEMSERIERLRALSEEGMNAVEDILSTVRSSVTDVARVQALGERLSQIDLDMELLGSTYEELRPMTTLFQFGREDLHGKDILELAQQSFSLYEVLHIQSLYMNWGLQKLCVAIGGNQTEPCVSNPVHLKN